MKLCRKDNELIRCIRQKSLTLTPKEPSFFIHFHSVFELIYEIYAYLCLYKRIHIINIMP